MLTDFPDLYRYHRGCKAFFYSQTIGDKISWDTSEKKVHLMSMFYLFLSKRVWNTFQWHTFPLPYSMLYDWPQCLWALRNDPTMSRGEGAGAQGTSKHLFLGKCQNSFARRLQVNTAYPKRTRRHTLPSRCINFKDKKSLIFDFVLSLSLSQLRAIARRHVSYRQKHQYRFFFHLGFDFGSIIFLHLHQLFATFYIKFWIWYVCRRHYHEGLPSGQVVTRTRVKVNNSHYRKVSSMQLAGSALTGWKAMSKKQCKC